MIKREIISLLKNLLPKQDKTGKYHDAVVGAALNVVYSNMLNDIHSQDARELDNYVTTYRNVTIADTYTPYPHSTVPVSYVSFRDKASGIRRIWGYDDSDVLIRFYPMDSREVDLAQRGSMMGQAGTGARIGYVVKPTTVEYFNATSSGSLRIDAVNMDVVVEFSALDEDDVVKLPHGKENMLIAGALEMLGVIPPVDLRDNNADTQSSE
jgi:hypothetical protein